MARMPRTTVRGTNASLGNRTNITIAWNINRGETEFISIDDVEALPTKLPTKWKPSSKAKPVVLYALASVTRAGNNLRLVLTYEQKHQTSKRAREARSGEATIEWRPGQVTGTAIWADADKNDAKYWDGHAEGIDISYGQSKIEDFADDTELTVSWRPDFERGRTYNRRKDIHGKFGGQQQGGISTPKGPSVLLFTGQQGTTYGYHDHMLPDGTFEYTGEGQAGHMEFVRGNKAIRDHAKDGKDLLLFETLKTKGLCRFLGTYVCDGWDIRTAKDKVGKQRHAIVFRLLPIENLNAEMPEAAPKSGLSLEQLRELAYQAPTGSSGAPGKGTRNVYARSRDVRDYVLARANGVCESCNIAAPFIRLDGTPYLEPHHTRRLSDGGPDHPRWVGAICPTCHREIHHGAHGSVKNAALEDRLGKIETANEPS